MPPAHVLPQWGQWPDRLYEQLLDRRIVPAHGHLDGELATRLCAQLMTLDATGEEPISLHLRTADGELEAAFAVADTIDALTCSVHALAAGQVGGPALAVLAAAGRRSIARHATLRLTEPRVRFAGTASDVAAREEEHRRLVDAFYLRLSDVTGREVDEIRDDARRGRFLTGQQALAYGLVHDVQNTAPPAGRGSNPLSSTLGGLLEVAL